jgi:phosphatidate cytidylyltransferase
MDPGAIREGTESVPSRPSSEFMIRIYSAVFLIGVAVFLTLASTESFAVLVVVFISIMAWEWGRLVRGRGIDLTFAIQLASTWIASAVTVGGWPGWALLSVAVGTALALFLRLGQEDRGKAWWSASGVYYAGLPAIALIWLRSDPSYGIFAILYIFAVVWTTDSAAYVFGRWIGGPKLVPRISPKKTWAGLIGGALSAGLVGMLFGLFTDIPAPGLGLLALAFALIAQLGDLGESAVKRIFEIKDSSSLIPGHGGVLDRIDGLIFVAVTAGAIAWIAGPDSPGRALFFWF